MKQQDSAASSADKPAPKRAARPARAASAPADLPSDFGTTSKDEFISQRAYYYYESRGRVAGHELDDWLQAEAEFERMRAAAAPAVEVVEPQRVEKAAAPRRPAAGTARRTGERKSAT